MKKLVNLFPLVPFLLVFGLVIAGEYKNLHIVSSSGSGGINNVTGGLIFVTIDTTGPDTSGAAFTSEIYNTEATNGGVQAYAYIGYNQDSTDFYETFIVTLKTAMTNNRAALAWTVAADTLDSTAYIYYSYTGNDTLFKRYTWFELNIFDSASDSSATTARQYKFESGFLSKE